MSSELTNLLPPERLRRLKHLYFLRLATVGMLVLSGVAIVHGVLLLPSYLYVHQEVNEKQAELTSLTASLENAEEKEVSARVKELSEDSAYLGRLASTPAGSTAIRALLDVPRAGIVLYGFTYSAPAAKKPASMTVSGRAASRESLRSFEEALSKEPYITSTDLPISAYAKERDIDFTITLTGSLMP